MFEIDKNNNCKFKKLTKLKFFKINFSILNN